MSNNGKITQIIGAVVDVSFENELPEIYTALDRTLIKATGPVSGSLSNTKIDAGQLDIFRESVSSDLVISFTKGVKMIYDNN